MVQRLYLSDQVGQGAGEEYVYIHSLHVCNSVVNIRRDWLTLSRVVLPLMDSSAGPYMVVARRTCSAVTLVF